MERMATEAHSEMVTVFRSRLAVEHEEEYRRLAAELEEKVRALGGLVEFKTFVAEDGERLSLVVFSDSRRTRALARRRAPPGSPACRLGAAVRGVRDPHLPPRAEDAEGGAPIRGLPPQPAVKCEGGRIPSHFSAPAPAGDRSTRRSRPPSRGGSRTAFGAAGEVAGGSATSVGEPGRRCEVRSRSRPSLRLLHAPRTRVEGEADAPAKRGQRRGDRALNIRSPSGGAPPGGRGCATMAAEEER